MRRLVFVLSTVACCALFASPLWAQEKLAEGTWTGVVTPPGGAGLDVTYEVSYVDSELEIAIVPPASVGVGPFQMEDAVFDGETLTFEWGEPAGVTCTLTSGEDGTLSGECTDGSSPGQIEMVPPSGAR